MALTQVPIELSSTPGIVDNSNATAITIDSSENVGISSSSPSSYHAPADNLVIGSSGDNGLTIASGTSSGGTICFADGTSGGAQYAGFIDYQHNGDYMRFGTNLGVERLRISSAGNVELKGGQELRVYRGDNATYGSMKYLTGSGGLQLNDKNGDGISFVKADGATEYGRFDASGNLGIGTSSTSAKLTSSGVTGTTLIQAVGVDSNGFADVEIKSTGTAGASRLYFSDTAAQSGSIKYSHSDNSMQFATAAAERMRILSGGNITIGTVDAYFYSNASSGGTTIDAGFKLESSNQALEFWTADTERMRINASGNVGIGISSSLEKFTVANTSSGIVGRFTNNTNQTLDLGVISGSGAAGGVYYNNANSGYHAFQTGGSERMRIDASGNLALGDSNAYTHRLFVKGVGTNEAVGLAVGTNGDNIIRFYNSGLGTAGAIKVNSGGTTVAYYTSSDQRLKENIADADDAGSKVDAIQVRKFDWIADGSHQDYGMIAQELLEVAPEAVSVPEDSEEMMGVDYSKLVPMLVKEIQSLRARVAQLEN